MVINANKHAEGIGGHLSTFASSASLYEVGFNHFFRGKDDGQPGDHVYFQGHAAPGVYARAYLEGRLTEDDLDHFRREIGRTGLSSYRTRGSCRTSGSSPRCRWAGPITALYQARFNRYLQNRRLDDTSQSRLVLPRRRRVRRARDPRRAVLVARAARQPHLRRELQPAALDGPVRGNGKIIQELEASSAGRLERDQGDLGLEVGRAAAKDKDGVLPR
jgi:pyruvate dehydrogenase E1 component